MGRRPGAQQKESHRGGRTSAHQRAEEARSRGARTWTAGVSGRRIIVTEWLNSPETAASRNTGRVCFYYPHGRNNEPTARHRSKPRHLTALEYRLLPAALCAAGARRDLRVVRRRQAGCQCECSPGYVLHDPAEHSRELLVEVLPP